jgi:hypothetical protein
MPTKPKDELPQTAGDLRRLIAEKGYKWTVDPRLRDGDRLPRYARGGQLDRQGKSNAIEVPNVAEYLARQDPPPNPFVQDRWVELKLLSRKRRGTLTGSLPTSSVHRKRSRRLGRREGKNELCRLEKPLRVAMDQQRPQPGRMRKLLGIRDYRAL